MKKYAIILLAAAGIFSSCAKLDEVRTLPADQIVAPVLSALPAELVITPDNKSTIQKFAWSKADFGVGVQINYSVEASMGSGPKLALFTDIAATSTEQIYDALNTKLALATEFGGLGVPTDTPTAVNFFVSATIGRNFEKVYSAAVPVTVTVTSAERVYPKVWVIGGYCGWDFGKSQFLFDFTGTDVYAGVVDFGTAAADGFKLSGEGGWNDAVNWGTDGDAEAPEAEAAEIQLIASGGSGNISAYSHRFYRLAFTKSTLVLSQTKMGDKNFAFDRIGVIGDATPTAWDGDTEMAFDTAKQRFWVDMTLTDGEMKFRLNNAWDDDFGGGATAGSLAYKGSNIKVTAGNYRIYVNLNNPDEMTYELNPADYGKGGEEPEPEPTRAAWYLHGQTVATPDWGESAFTGAGTDGFKLAGVEVAANSEFLFKSGDDSQWIGPAASLGANPYPVTIGEAFAVSTDKVNGVIAAAGTYDYYLLPKQNVAYVVTAGAKPGLVADTWGVVGNLTDWGNLGDFAMTEVDGMQVRKNVYLGTDYEFKVRFGNEWGSDLGGATTDVQAIDTAIPTGSNNIKIDTAGVYDIYFDEAGSTIWVMTAGTKPAR